MLLKELLSLSPIVLEGLTTVKIDDTSLATLDAKEFTNFCHALAKCKNLREFNLDSDIIATLGLHKLQQLCDALATCGYLARVNSDYSLFDPTIKIPAFIAANTTIEDCEYFATLHAREIIASIKERGILPPKQLSTLGFHIRSVDEGGSSVQFGHNTSNSMTISTNYIAAAELNQLPTTEKNRIMKYLMLNTYVGLLPITTERFYSAKFCDIAALLQDLEDRMQHSVMFILDAAEHADSSCCTEERIDHGLPAKCIRAVLAPQQFYAMVKELFSGTNIQVISVANISIKYSAIPLNLALQQISCEIDGRTLGKSKLQDYLDENYADFEFSVPNYQESFAALLKTSLKDSKFYSHATRLPTTKDMQVLLIERGLVKAEEWLKWMRIKFEVQNIDRILAIGQPVLLEIQRAQLLAKLPGMVFGSQYVVAQEHYGTMQTETQRLLEKADEVLFRVRNGLRF